MFLAFIQLRIAIRFQQLASPRPARNLPLFGRRPQQAVAKPLALPRGVVAFKCQAKTGMTRQACDKALPPPCNLPPVRCVAARNLVPKRLSDYVDSE